MPAPDVTSWPGLAVVGPDDERLGTVDHAYVDRVTGAPTFLSIDTGTAGERPRLVPVVGASRDGDAVRLPHARRAVDGAPDVHDEAELTPGEEQRLYDHYGLARPDLRADHDATGADPAAVAPRPAEADPWATPVGRPIADPSTVEAPGDPIGRLIGSPAAPGAPGVPGPSSAAPCLPDATMTRSEEELDLDTRVVPKERVRLVRHVVTEEVTATVSVSHEEVRLEREPVVADAPGVVPVPGAPDRPPVPDVLSADEHEVVLHAEEVVVTKRIVPRERVRLVTDVVAGEIDVHESLRRERIDAEPADG